MSAILKSPSNTPASAFREVFTNPGANLNEVYIYYRKTIELAQGIKNMCNTFGGRTAIGFKDTMDKIQEALLSLEIERTDGFIAFRKKLSDKSAMSGLKSIADYIADQNIEIEIQQKSLDKILQDTNDLIIYVNGLTIDIALAKSIIANLNNIIFSVNEYSMFGSANIKHSISSTAGHVFIKTVHQQPTEESLTLMQHVLSKMRDFNTIVSFTTTMAPTLPIIFEAVKLLSGS